MCFNLDIVLYIIYTPYFIKIYIKLDNEKKISKTIYK